MICVRTKSLHITLEGDQQFCSSTRGSRLQREEFKRRHFKQTVFFSPFWFLGMTWVTGFFFCPSHAYVCYARFLQFKFCSFFFLNKKMNNKIEKAFFFIIAAVSYQTSASISILNLYKRWDISYSPGSLCSFCYLQFIANASGHHQMYGALN